MESTERTSKSFSYVLDFKIVQLIQFLCYLPNNAPFLRSQLKENWNVANEEDSWKVAYKLGIVEARRYQFKGIECFYPPPPDTARRSWAINSSFTPEFSFSFKVVRTKCQKEKTFLLEVFLDQDSRSLLDIPAGHFQPNVLRILMRSSKK